ncbi:MAG: pilus assembly PilX family protein [Pseudomonadota bacterium]
MNRRLRPLVAPARRQRGATLVVVLILLLLMTLLGLASLRSTVLEERMTANLLDRSLGFQVAEAGLREAEASLNPNPAFPVAGCNANGLCARPDPAAVERWLDPGFNSWRTGSVFDPSTAAPQYIVEDMGEGPNWRDCDRLSPIHPLCLTPRYRVTVRSQQDGRASVLLQTIYAGK